MKIFFGKKECQSFISILQELFFPEFKSENQKERIYYKKKNHYFKHAKENAI